MSAIAYNGTLTNTNITFPSPPYPLGFVLQETFEAGLQAFENEGIARVTSLKDELVKSQHEQSPAIIRRHDDLITRCVHPTHGRTGEGVRGS